MPTSRPPIPKDIRALVESACKDVGLSPFAEKTVERWVRDGPDAWASCCMGGCDPCNDVIRAAARRVLAALDGTTP